MAKYQTVHVPVNPFSVLCLAWGMSAFSQPLLADELIIIPNNPAFVIQNVDFAAADDDDIVGPSSNDGWDEDEPAPLPAGQVVGRRVVLSVSVEHWIFGQEGTHGSDLLKSFLQQKLASVKREYEELEPSHLEKLALAGRGDIKRFEDQVAALKAKYPQNTIDQVQLQTVLAEVQTLRQRLRSDQFFGNQSLLAKTLLALVVKQKLKPKLVAPADGRAMRSQLKVPNDNGLLILGGPVAENLPVLGNKRLPNIIRFNPIAIDVIELRGEDAQKPAVEPLRDDQYYRRLIQIIITSFDPETPFRDEQREPLIALLRKVSQRTAQIRVDDPALTLYQLSKLPEEEFLSVLDRDQWNCLRRSFDKAKNELQKRKEAAQLAFPVRLPIPGVLRNDFSTLRRDDPIRDND